MARKKTSIDDTTKNELMAAIGAPAAKGEQDNSGIPVKQQYSEPEIKKSKATYYIDSEVLEEFERIHYQLRRLTGKKLAKGVIVEAALRAAITDFDKNKDASKIAVMLK